MNKKSVLLIFILISFSKFAFASNFIGFGSGFHFSKSYNDDENSKNNFIPIVLEYEYSSGYRDLWMFHASVSYFNSTNSAASNDLIVSTIGIKYVPKFYYYTGNYTEKAYEKYGCFSFILLPITIVRDTLINTLQLFILRHPFLTISFVHIIEGNENNYYGFSVMPGITNGLIDFKLKYTQNIKYDAHIKTDLFIIGFEITFHFSLQDKFIRKKPLID